MLKTNFTIFENRRLRKFRRDQLNIEKNKVYQSVIIQRYPILSKCLCANGPSFIPTPIQVDLLQLQKDLE